MGGIRRAYFEQGHPIKEIVRTLSVSRGRNISRCSPNLTWRA